MVVVDWGDFPLKWRHLSHLPRDRTVIYPYFSGISVFFYLFGENWIIINCVGLVSLDGLGNCAVCAQLHHGGGPGDTGGTWLEFIGATWVPAFMKACENRSIIGEQPKAYVTYKYIYICLYRVDLLSTRTQWFQACFFQITQYLWNWPSTKHQRLASHKLLQQGLWRCTTFGQRGLRDPLDALGKPGSNMW